MILQRLMPRNQEFIEDPGSSFGDHILFLETLHSDFTLSHSTEGLSIITVNGGSAELSVGNTICRLDDSRWLLADIGSLIKLRRTSRHATYCQLCFEPEIAEMIAVNWFENYQSSNESKTFLSCNLDFSILERLHNRDNKIYNMMEQLVILGGNGSASFQALKADLVVRSLLEYLLKKREEALKIASCLPVVKASTRKTMYKSLVAAKEWMEINSFQTITLSEIAEVAMMSDEHFLRMFKAGYGITPIQYLIHYRICEAERLLSETGLSITEITGRVGYQSVSNFSWMFKEHTGYSPSEYRKRV